ncbi:hypothetical protein CLAIMM_15193 isoform 2 [Cladophialophora immunda]|nr:hypothetical protein CLAIMM_15193 isoform 1 [Cladophialophora immunda]OQV11344.1 hypothetical protein CLAIMM_15193 isoform 2 [Cladophialophora immunda]
MNNTLYSWIYIVNGATGVMFGPLRDFFDLAASVITLRHRRAVRDVPLAQIALRRDEDGRSVADEEFGRLPWIADGNLAMFIKYLVAVKDMICCYKIRQESFMLSSIQARSWVGKKESPCFLVAPR